MLRLLLALLGIELHQKTRLPKPPRLPEEEPFPLTHRDVERQQEQIRKATAHGSGEHRIERSTMIPPKST